MCRIFVRSDTYNFLIRQLIINKMTRLAAIATSEYSTPILCDTQDLELSVNDFCVVRDTDGSETTGYIKTFSNFCELQLKHRPLGRVLRKAESEDVRAWHFLKRREKEAVEKCKEYVAKHKLDMKISSVKFNDNEHKIVFNFTADDRVDFRELVKDLASEFHSRIELWQIGVRDEAKEIGGLGCCGLTMCCTTWMHKFIPVSIRYAKAQDIQFSPSKLSGACGRLRCCLAYEQKQYVEMGKNVPPVGSRVESDEFGVARVADRNLLSGQLTLSNGEKYLTVSVNDVNCKKIRAPKDDEERGWTKGQKIWLLESKDAETNAQESTAEKHDEVKVQNEPKTETNKSETQKPSDTQQRENNSEQNNRRSRRGRRRSTKQNQSDRDANREAKNSNNKKKGNDRSGSSSKRRSRRGGRRRNKRDTDRGGKSS